MAEDEHTAPILISTGTLGNDALAGKVAVVTGAGRGIGYETARSLAWLGAQVVIAEIDKTAGEEAALKINEEIGESRVTFIQTDIGSEKGLRQLRDKVVKSFEKVDIIINNAAVAPVGAVKDLSTDTLDDSYHVNLRGPALLAGYFLPGMLERDYGVIVCVSSSGGVYTGGYEVFKRAQVGLAETLAAELEDTGVIAFSISPGQALTPGLEEIFAQLASLHGKTYDEYIAMKEGATVPVAAAGAGFAAAVALASQFRGQEITSTQALAAAGIKVPVRRGGGAEFGFNDEQAIEALALCRKSRQTLSEQSAMWHKLPLFERKWMLSNFEKVTGFTVEEWLEQLEQLGQALEERDGGMLAAVQAPVSKLAEYWKHLQELAVGFIDDEKTLEKQQKIIAEWHKTAESLADILKTESGTE